jgi:hypothetical protein
MGKKMVKNRPDANPTSKRVRGKQTSKNNVKRGQKKDESGTGRSIRGLRPPVQTIRVTAIRCPRCDDILFSRAHHDFRSCTCGYCFIDGGFDYVRVGGDVGETFHLNIEATKKDLYDDWNHHGTLYGLIKEVK